MSVAAVVIISMSGGGCFEPRAHTGLPCTDWCPPPESCLAGTCRTTDPSGDGDAGSDASTGPPHNIVFVTSTAKAPYSFGGVGGADAFCQSLADLSPLGGHYRAWISESIPNSAATHITETGARGWIRPDGKPFADTVQDITTGHIFYPPVITETSLDLGTSGQPLIAVTGTSPSGNTDSNANCNGFADPDATARFGYADAGSIKWTDAATTTCDVPYRIYCFGTDFTEPVVVNSEPGRLAFVSTLNATLGSLGTLDATCQSEAAALPNNTAHFRALVAPSGLAAAARFNLGGLPWMRPDGTRITDDLVHWLAPIDQHADGTRLGATDLGSVLAGAASTTAPGDSSLDCANWTTPSGNVLLGDARRSSPPAFGTDGTDACNAGHPVYCFEQ